MLLACSLCGGVVEMAVAGGGITLAAYGATELWIRLTSKQPPKKDRSSPPRVCSLEVHDDGTSPAQDEIDDRFTWDHSNA